MAVLGRSLSLTVGDNGELLGVMAYNLQRGQPPFLLVEPNSDGSRPYAKVQRDNRNQELTKNLCYGAGARILATVTTCERKPLNLFSPVIALKADSDKDASPFQGTLIEGATDPELKYDPKTGTYHLFYWVNAWSPPSSEISEPSLFQKTKPASNLGHIDPGYSENTNSFQPPPRNFTCVRDLPNWYSDGRFSEPPESWFNVPEPTNEKVGEFNINSFWVAPWSDAHSYRFPKNYDPFKDPPMADPDVPQAAPSQQSSNSDFLSYLDFYSKPNLTIQREVKNALYRMKQNKALRFSERATLEEYALMPMRMAYLSRTNRVLMHATGRVHVASKFDTKEEAVLLGASLPKDTVGDESSYHNFLVVEQPRPVFALKRGVNKLMVGRQKWVSFVNGSDVFITAPLNYRYPSAGTVALTFGDPQVDFCWHDTFVQTNGFRNGVHLPESEIPQRPQYLPEKDLLIPTFGGISLIELLSSSSSWSGL